jgi:hypothetical protein
MRISEHARVLGLVCVLAVHGGCGKQTIKTYPVALKVTYADQKPVTGAQVILRSEEAKVSARGIVGSDGTCRLTTFKPDDGAVLGHHQVLVAKPPLQGDPDKPYSGPKIADKYSSFATSGLEVNVTPDAEKNTFDLKVTPH